MAKKTTKKTAPKRSSATKTAAKKTAKKTTKKASTKTTKKPATKKKATTVKKKTTKTATKKSSPAKKKTKASVEVEVKVDRRATAKADRREEEDRRQDVVAVENDQREAPERRKVARRRQIDPTTCERDYSNDEIEFMHALDDYKRKAGRMFPTCSEILEVVRDLGYRRLTPEEMAAIAPLNPAPVEAEPAASDIDEDELASGSNAAPLFGEPVVSTLPTAGPAINDLAMQESSLEDFEA